MVVPVLLTFTCRNFKLFMTKEPFDYIRYDLAGYPFNYKYPPKKDCNGGMYHGYRNDIEETFFYDFAVQRYDLRFSYNGKVYYFLCSESYVAQCDETFTKEFERYRDGNDMLERFTIDGVRLLDLISEIQDVEAM